MALSAAQRYQLNLLGVPDGTLADPDLYALAGVIQAESSAPTSLTEAQRYQLNLMGVPDSSLAVGDRYALAGVVETAISTGPNIQQFNVTWNIAPTWARAASSADAQIQIAMAAFTFSGVGSFVGVGSTDALFTHLAKVTLHNNPVTFATRITDYLAGATQTVDFFAAKTWIVDKLIAKTVVSVQQPPLVCGSVRFKDPVCAHTKITDYIAAKTRTPGTEL